MSDETEETPLIRDLREQIKKKDKKIQTLEQTVRTTVFTDVFAEYGLDPSKGAGKLAADSYDGDLDANSLSEWLTEAGFEPVEDTTGDSETQEQEEPAGVEQRQQQQQRLQQVRENSTATQGQRVPHDQWKQMFSGTPDQRAEAVRLHEQGLVDVPTAS